MAIGSGQRFMCGCATVPTKGLVEPAASLGAVSARHGQVTPKDSTHLPVVRATPGQLDHFAALALQQLGQQPALREGRGVFCHNVVFHVRGTNFHRFPGLYLWGLGPNGERNFYSRYHVV
jgi:hypothetical protein